MVFFACFFFFCFKPKLSFLPVKQVGQNLRLAEFLENFSSVFSFLFIFFLPPIRMMFFRLLKSSRSLGSMTFCIKAP